MSDLLVVDRGSVRTITLNRPASRNGLTHQLGSQITAFLQKRAPSFRGH